MRMRMRETEKFSLGRDESKKSSVERTTAFAGSHHSCMEMHSCTILSVLSPCRYLDICRGAVNIVLDIGPGVDMLGNHGQIKSPVCTLARPAGVVGSCCFEIQMLAQTLMEIVHSQSSLQPLDLPYCAVLIRSCVDFRRG